jgi:hypothetical protein
MRRSSVSMLDFDVMRLTRYRSRKFSFVTLAPQPYGARGYFVCRSAALIGFFPDMAISFPVHFEVT